MQLNKASLLTVLFTSLTIICRICGFIFSPLWLDSISHGGKNTNTSDINTTKEPHDDVTRRTNPYFFAFIQAIIPCTFFMLCYIWIILIKPRLFTDTERTYPKRYIFFAGFSQSLSSLLINYSLSGTRTAPYLQAVLNNFNIPIQFVLRFAILKKFPTCRKLICTILVILAEFMCLLPSIDPQLESKTQHANDGGSSGVGGVLWPLCFVCSMIPYSLANVFIERSLTIRNTNTGQIHMVYYMFWWTLSMLTGICLFFWVDIIPGFGTSDSLREFGEVFWFNTACLVGQKGCGPNVYLLAWAVVAATLTAYWTIASVLRYSEGANYLIVAMCLRSPFLFLFWTLFEEDPFKWHPHTDLSTWLSIGALAIMVPSIISYNTGPPEKSLRSSLILESTDDTDTLLSNDTTEQNMDIN